VVLLGWVVGFGWGVGFFFLCGVGVGWLVGFVVGVAVFFWVLVGRWGFFLVLWGFAGGMTAQ